MKPAPPVIIIFLTSGSGVYFVLPVRIGASFQTPKSSKNLFVWSFACAGVFNQVSLQSVQILLLKTQRCTTYWGLRLKPC